MIHINVTCDECNQVAQGLVFDSDTETCADLKAALESIGWLVAQGSGTKAVRTCCKGCVQRLTTLAKETTHEPPCAI